MAGLGFTPLPVNSKKARFKGTRFDKDYIKFHQRFSGALVMTMADFKAQNFPPGNLHSLDLADDVFMGSAVLIDFNLILMCLHTLQPLSNSMMAQNQLRVVFNNDILASDADNAKGPFGSEQPRPFAFVRADKAAFIGRDTTDEDFAIVAIEWNKRGDQEDFHLVGKSAVLPSPSFDRTSLEGKRCAAFLQYSKMKQAKGLHQFSGHVAQGPVEGTNQSHEKADPDVVGNRVWVNVEARFGSSGSGFYNEDGELVGVLGGGIAGGRTFFLPLDVIYASKNKAFGREAGEVLKSIFDFRKAQGEFVGEGKGKPVK
jgi:hypothetical protein